MGKHIFTCTEISLECDYCDNWHLERTGDIELTKIAILKRLRSEGWKIGRELVQCPKCSRKNKGVI